MTEQEKNSQDEKIVLWYFHSDGMSNGRHIGITEQAFLLPARHRILMRELVTGQEEKIETVQVPETVVDAKSAIAYLDEHGYVTY